MNPRQFFDRVAAMRKIQKDCRDPTALQALEQEIDDEIERVQYIIAHDQSLRSPETPDHSQCHFIGKDDCCRRQCRVQGMKVYILPCQIAKFNKKECSHFITTPEYNYMKKIKLHFPKTK